MALAGTGIHPVCRDAGVGDRGSFEGGNPLVDCLALSCDVDGLARTSIIPKKEDEYDFDRCETIRRGVTMVEPSASGSGNQLGSQMEQKPAQTSAIPLEMANGAVEDRQRSGFHCVWIGRHGGNQHDRPGILSIDCRVVRVWAGRDLRGNRN